MLFASTALTVIMNVIKQIDFKAAAEKGNIIGTELTGSKSLSDVSKLTRVEPLLIISRDCMNLPYMVDINNSLLNIFAGYYLQAINILSSVKYCEVVKTLDMLNPQRNRDSFFYAKEEIKGISVEDYKYSLPMSTNVSLEADDSPDNIKMLNELSSLSVGKMLNVSIDVKDGYKKDKDGNSTKEPSYKEITIPVTVRLMANVIANNSILHILANKTDDTTFDERWHAWRSGRISFWQDLVMCQDLIAEHGKAILKDDTGVLDKILARVRANRIVGLTKGTISLAQASNLFVISEQVAKELEFKLGGKLSNPKIREKAFENTYAMIIVVVDRDYERITFYTRNTAAAADFSINEIKAAGKGKGPDILDIMKQMQLGSPISF